MIAKILVVSLIVACIYCIIVIAFDMISAARGQAERKEDCRPHIYLSGTVEIRGARDRYVVEYESLAELAELLSVIDADRAGRIQWIGRD